MNLPVTNPIVKNVSLNKIDINRLFMDLYDKKFEGYCHLNILETHGFEESILVMSKGEIIGSIFLIPGYDIELYGVEGLLYSMNSYGSKEGVLNIFGLSSDQINFVILFNDKIKLSKHIFPEKKKEFIFKNLKYNANLTKEILLGKTKEEKSNKDILNEFNLNDLLKE